MLDGTFLTRELQHRAVELGAGQGARALLVNCTLPPHVAAARIETRRDAGGDLSEAGVDTHHAQREQEDAPPAELPQCQIETSAGVPAMVQGVLERLAEEK